MLSATDVGIEDDNLVAVMFEQFFSLSLVAKQFERSSFNIDIK